MNRTIHNFNISVLTLNLCCKFMMYEPVCMEFDQHYM
uniref:Formin-2 isoform x1 n=1 Tax=Triatoma infestans TaxID=30076 RepID=A0A161MC96_TRIIF